MNGSSFILRVAKSNGGSWRSTRDNRNREVLLIIIIILHVPINIHNRAEKKNKCWILLLSVPLHHPRMYKNTTLTKSIAANSRSYKQRGPLGHHRTWLTKTGSGQSISHNDFRWLHHAPLLFLSTSSYSQSLVALSPLCFAMYSRLKIPRIPPYCSRHENMCSHLNVKKVSMVHLCSLSSLKKSQSLWQSVGTFLAKRCL